MSWEKRFNAFQFANLNVQSINNGHVMSLGMTKKQNGDFFVYRQQLCAKVKYTNIA
jgi:hypothetical protein